jgi:hypothetical protein
MAEDPPGWNLAFGMTDHAEVNSSINYITDSHPKHLLL